MKEQVGKVHTDFPPPEHPLSRCESPVAQGHPAASASSNWRKRGRIFWNSEFLPPRASCRATSSSGDVGSTGESEATL